MMLSTVETPLPRSRAGRAPDGSRRQLQDYVNQIPSCLNGAIERQLPEETTTAQTQFHWLSPLASAGFREYRDASFLEQLGIPEAAEELAQFWPPTGPCWDGLAVMARTNGRVQAVLLVEARSHLDEIDGPGWRITPPYRPMVQDAFRETRQWLGAHETKAWTGSLFQSATRLAHLNFLRNRLAVPAWLVQVYFVNAPGSGASRADWLPVIAGAHARLGLCRRPPFTIDVFLPALHAD